MRRPGWIAFALMMAMPAHAAMTISSAKTKNVSCTDGVCTPTAGNANLSVGDLVTLLASSDVTVKSSASVPTLGVLDPLTWSTTHRLTLDLYESIHVRAPIVVEGTSGLTLITDDGGTGGDYDFVAPGSITFWDTASSLVINGHTFKLVKDIKSLADGITAKASGNYALANSYDASVDGIYTSIPIGKKAKGRVEGLGNSIANLSIELWKGNAGLFQSIGARGSVENLVVENILVTDSRGSNQIGALAVVNYGQIHNVSVSGKIDGVGVVIGGLVGDNGGSISSSYSSVAVSGKDDKLKQGTLIGGIAGSSGGTIIACHSASDLWAYDGFAAGGLVGENLGAISNSSASGSIRTNRGILGGGLIGEMYRGQVSGSFATGTVDAGNGSAGGLIGYLFDGDISNSFSTGSAAGEETGGLIGSFSRNSITAVYSTGQVSGTFASGGLIGYETANALASSAYWDVDTSGSQQGIGGGDGSGDGITGITDAQLKTHPPAGFDPAVWGQSANINNGWPYLLANPPQ